MRVLSVGEGAPLVVWRGHETTSGARLLDTVSQHLDEPVDFFRCVVGVRADAQPSRPSVDDNARVAAAAHQLAAAVTWYAQRHDAGLVFGLAAAEHGEPRLRGLLTQVIRQFQDTRLHRWNA